MRKSTQAEESTVEEEQIAIPESPTFQEALKAAEVISPIVDKLLSYYWG